MNGSGMMCVDRSIYIYMGEFDEVGKKKLIEIIQW